MGSIGASGGGDAFDGGIITDGNFPSGDNWSAGGGWSIGGGVASYDDITNASSLSQADTDMVSTILDNTDYRLTFDISNASTYARLTLHYLSSDIALVATANYINGSHVVDFTSLNGPTGVAFIVYTSGSSFDITNISLKER